MDVGGVEDAEDTGVEDVGAEDIGTEEAEVLEAREGSGVETGDAVV